MVQFVDQCGVVTMKLLIAAAVLALAAGSVIKDDLTETVITKETMANIDVKTKERYILKLLNFILQPTMYEDIRDIAREWVIEDNIDKYLKVDVVRNFIKTYKLGMLPRGEMFMHTNELHIKEAIKVFRLLYFAKDFDTFIKTACWLRERINPGMFTYCLTIAVFHRTDCNGIVLPAIYEIYPYLYVDSSIIKKAHLLKMTKGWLDPVFKDYYGITVKDNNVAIIDWRKDLRHVLTQNDRLSYFTEDIDLNAYFYYLHINYPVWLTDQVYSVNKERRGEVLSYAYLQLLSRLRLERLARRMCDIKPFKWDKPIKNGYWPKIVLPTGDEMPVRYNNVDVNTVDSDFLIRHIDDLEALLRHVLLTGQIVTRDGTVITIRKYEDIEVLARMILGGLDDSSYNDLKYSNLVLLLRKLLTYNIFYMNKHTYIPTSLDMDSTCLRDPVCWQIIKRVSDFFIYFKRMLPKYTREELEFTGVKVENIQTDKLVTFIDEFDLDITNAVYLDQTEFKKHQSDMVYVARMRRLNHHPFKVTVDVVSDKAVEAVVRIFIGPKYDCMGRLLNVNDVRLDMVEIDSFLYKLDTGKNTIVRDSLEMHGVIQQRPWTRSMEGVSHNNINSGSEATIDNWWYKSRIGYPHRLLLPLGTIGGVPYQIFVIVTPIHSSTILPTVDVTLMKQRHICPWASCVDNLPLGFPFDRPIDETSFWTTNMKTKDVLVYRKDLDRANTVKDVDLSEMVLKRDDLTYLDTDMLVRRSYKSVMSMSTDNMTHM